MAKLSLREDICTSANEDCCIATRQGPLASAESGGRGMGEGRAGSAVGFKLGRAVGATPGFLSSPARPATHSQTRAKAAPPSPCPK